MLTQAKANIPIIIWESLKIEQLIGNGSFGDVFLGSWNTAGTLKQVAIKVLKIPNYSREIIETFINEANIMWDSQGPNTIKVYGICTETYHCSIILEYMKNGSLYRWLNNSSNITWAQRWQIAIDVAQGLKMLHDKNIVIHDLKSSNILLDNDYRAKISNFGLSKIKKEITKSSTIRWCAPETFKYGYAITPSVDIYSYGMLLWEMVTQKLPFSDAQDEITVMGWLKDGEKENIPEYCPQTWKQLINSCWNDDPAKRPSAADVINYLQLYPHESAAPILPIISTNRGSEIISITTPTSTELSNIPILNTAQLRDLLHKVAFGKQNEAEIILQQNRQLALFAGDVIDCAKREFKQITAFQYAIWALDFHMWQMIRKYLTDVEVRQQVALLDDGAWVQLHGTQVSWQKLIDNLAEYKQNYSKWDWRQCNNFWCQQVGGAQLLLPAHVINEYSHPQRSLYPCPNYGNDEPILLRTGVEIWFGDKTNILGRDYAWARGRAHAVQKLGTPVSDSRVRRIFRTCVKSGHDTLGCGCDWRAPDDAEAMTILLNARKQQLKQMIREVNPFTWPRP